MTVTYCYRGIKYTKTKQRTTIQQTKMKSFIALGTLATMVATPAMAGPYVNTEINSGWAGSDYGGSVTDLHIGYEGNVDRLGYYLQAGPAIVSPDGGDADTEFSGKAGGSFQATQAVSVYGEISFLTTDADENNYGTKAGLKWAFQMDLLYVMFLVLLLGFGMEMTWSTKRK